MIKGGNPRTVFTALSIRSRRMSSLITLSISKGVNGDIMTNGLHIYRLSLVTSEAFILGHSLVIIK